MLDLSVVLQKVIGDLNKLLNSSKPLTFDRTGAFTAENIVTAAVFSSLVLFSALVAYTMLTDAFVQAPDGVTLENLANPSLMDESVHRDYERFMYYHSKLKNEVSELFSYLMIRLWILTPVAVLMSSLFPSRNKNENNTIDADQIIKVLAPLATRGNVEIASNNKNKIKKSELECILSKLTFFAGKNIAESDQQDACYDVMQTLSDDFTVYNRSV